MDIIFPQSSAATVKASKTKEAVASQNILSIS